MFYVYGLHLEGDDEIRYIGSTCNPRSRLWGHGRGDGSNPAKDEWAVPNRAKLRMKIFHSAVPEKDRRRVEQDVINECKKKGYRLFNHRGAARHAADTQDVAWWLDQIEGDKSPC